MNRLKGYTKEELERIREKKKQGMQEVTVKLSTGDAARIASCMEMRLLEYQDDAKKIEAKGEALPLWLIESMSEKNNILRIMRDALNQQPPASKQPPVDRGKLLIGLECCRDAECGQCPYYSFNNCDKIAFDALAYIGFLEEQLGVTGL